MHELFNILLITTIVITYWTVLFIFIDKKGDKQLNRWFCYFLIALTFPQIDLYANQINQHNFTLTIIATTFLWLKGPFILVFTQTLLKKNKTLLSTYIHFFPWALAIVYIINFPEHFTKHIMLGMSHMMLYLVISLGLLISNKQRIYNIFTGFTNSTFYWLIYIIAGLMLLVFLDFIIMMLVHVQMLTNYDLMYFYVFPTFCVYILSIAILCLVRPVFLFKEQEPNIDTASTEETLIYENEKSLTSETSSTNEKDSQNRQTQLSETVASDLKKTLLDKMQNEQIYLNNDLSLKDLADHLALSIHQTSELLNVHCQSNFHDFLNQFRLQYACNLLEDPNCQLRILDIAFEAGFNNKNSFYREFKNRYNLTPNQYRSSAKSQLATT